MSFITAVILYARQHPRLTLGAKFLVIFAVFLLVSLMRLDNDFGWHLKAGDYIREYGVPAKDIFTYTAADFRWINHEVAHDVLLSLIYSIGGYGVVAAVFAVLWTLSLFIASKAKNLYVMLLAALALVPYAGIRPNIWTVLGLVALVRLAAKPIDVKRGLLVILLLGLWANFHGGFVLGLGILIFYAVKQKNPHWLLVFAFSAAASLINPYGAEVYVEIIRTLGDNDLRFQINEWRAAWIPLPSWPFVAVWFGLMAYVAGLKWRKWFELPTLLFIASLSASRNIPLFIVSAVGGVESMITKVASKMPPGINKKQKAILFTLFAVPMFIGIYGAAKDLRPWIDKEYYYPVAAAAYLRDNGCSGNLFNSYNYGGYLVWQTPKTKVYIDGRMPSWKDSSGESYLKRHNEISLDKEERRAEFEKYNIRCAVIPSTYGKFIKEQEEAGWRVVAGDTAALLIKD